MPDWVIIIWWLVWIFSPSLSSIFFIRYLDVLFQPRISLSLSFFKLTFFKYNLHTIKYNKYIGQWIVINVHICLILHSKHRTLKKKEHFHHPKKAPSDIFLVNCFPLCPGNHILVGLFLFPQHCFWDSSLLCVSVMFSVFISGYSILFTYLNWFIF